MPKFSNYINEKISLFNSFLLTFEFVSFDELNEIEIIDNVKFMIRNVPTITII